MSDVKPYTREEIAEIAKWAIPCNDGPLRAWPMDVPRWLATVRAVEAERDEADANAHQWHAAADLAQREAERLRGALEGVLQHGEALKNAWINEVNDVLYVDRWNIAQSKGIAALTPQPEVGP